MQTMPFYRPEHVRSGRFAVTFKDAVGRALQKLDSAYPQTWRYLCVALAFLVCVSAHGQQLFPQNPSTIQGPSQNSTSSATETVNNSNGDVVVSIPLVARRGISGLDFALSVQYDSKNHDLKGTINPGIWGGLNWDTPNNFGPDFGSGRLSIPRLYSKNLAIDSIDVGLPDPATLNCDTAFEFRDSDGSIHSFDNTINCMLQSGPGASPFPERNRPIIDTLDGTMMRLDLSDSSTAKVILESGTVIRFSPLGGYATSITDRFGNQITFSGAPQSGMTITDSVGRVITISNASHRITYKNSNGGDVFIDLTRTSSNGDTLSLHAENCHYYGPVQPGGDRANVIASHDLVVNTNQTDTIVIDSQGDARTFTVDTNALGEITKVGYPTGGYTRYTFQAFPGAYSVGDFACGTYGVREVSSKKVCNSSAGSCTNEITTGYTPNLVNAANSTMTIIEPSDDTGHQRKVVHEFGGSFAVGTAGMNTFREIKESIYDNLTTLLKTTEISYTNFVGYTGDDIIWSSQPKDRTVTLYGQSGNAVSSTRTHYDYDPITLVIGAPYANSTYQIYFNQPKTISLYDPSNNLLQSSSQDWKNTAPYTPDGNHILDLVNSKSLTTSDGSYITDTYNYDTAGLLTSIVKSGSGVSSITTGYELDASGRITKITDPRSHSTNYQYTAPWSDSNCSVGSTSDQPASVQNAKDQTTTQKYYSCSGLLASSTDPNGATTSYTYDSSDRLKSVALSDLGGSTMTYSTNQFQKRERLDAARSINRVSVLDGLGRVTETQILNDPACSGGTSHIGTSYDDVGRVSKTTNPYCSILDATYGADSTLYDALDRPIIVAHSDQSKLQYCYNGLAVVTQQTNCLSKDPTAPTNATWSDQTDEVGRRWQRVSDALGRLVQVSEFGTSSGSLQLRTDYGFNGFGNLASVNQHGDSSDTARQRSFSYDSFSRLTTSTNPETGTICYGIWSGSNCINGYDENGNLKKKTDSRGVTTSLDYDVLNRLISKTYFGGSAATRSSCYQYDTATNGTGRLGAEWTQAGTCPPAPQNNPETRHTILAYDAMGRITGDQQCHRDKCSAPITSAMHYDLVGNPTYYSNGIGSIELSPTYDAAGRLQTIGSSLYGAQLPSYPATLLSIGAYNPAGAIQNMNLGPVITVNRTYDNRLRITGQIVTHP